MLSRVVMRQLELLGIHQELILGLDQENRRRFERVERMLDLQGQTFGNPILINSDPDEVTLVEEPALVRDLIPINENPDGLDE